MCGSNDTQFLFNKYTGKNSGDLQQFEKTHRWTRNIKNIKEKVRYIMNT